MDGIKLVKQMVCIVYTDVLKWKVVTDVSNYQAG